jgi:hypothetical protein
MPRKNSLIRYDYYEALQSLHNQTNRFISLGEAYDSERVYA